MLRLATTFILLAFAACRSNAARPTADSPSLDGTTPAVQTLADARRGFETHVRDTPRPAGPAPTPPASVFSRVHYPSPAGSLAAYVTPRPVDGSRHPAIVWVIGGFDASIDDSAWAPAPADNDQSARAFREAGIVLMLPSLRGGNDNPGKRETLYGEVDDVIAAGDYVAKLDYVDPARVYLGGHSTGGTLVLLVAESTDRFRTIFAFGPVGDVKSYADEATFDIADGTESRLRSPMNFLQAIRTPTFIFEGGSRPSNAGALPYLKPKDATVPVRTFRVAGVNHFSILSPVTGLLARKIMATTGEVDITDGDLSKAIFDSTSGR